MIYVFHKVNTKRISLPNKKPHFKKWNVLKVSYL